jgi:hypothetical protein
MLKVANGIFIKQSVDLAGLRQATKPLMKHVLRGRGAIDTGHGISSVNKGGQMGAAPRLRATGQLAGKILQPAGGAMRQLESYSRSAYGTPELTDAVSVLTPKAKEMMNRMALLHEGSERAFSPTSMRGAMDRYFGAKHMGAHVDPRVIGQESNMLASMPTGGDYDLVRTAYTAMRNATGEIPVFNRSITPSGYGQNRMTRSALQATREFWPPVNKQV